MNNWHLGHWKNKKTGKTREGTWVYNWAGDYFLVRINGVHRDYQDPQKIYNERPDCGNWIYKGVK